jgi:hypothetical protein
MGKLQAPGIHSTFRARATLYHEDRENRAVIISDCGKESCNLKSLLRTVPPSLAISRTIGYLLGTSRLDSQAQLAAVATVAKEMQAHIKLSDDVLTMGDFWAGNLLVIFDRARDTSEGVHVDIVDCELTKPGLAGLNIGQFLGLVYRRARWSIAA